jgi:ABC-2 type transport system permease protein
MKDGFKAARAVSIARKEVRHILRDPYTLALALGLPVLMVSFFGYAIDFDVRDVGLLAVNGDGTRASRELLEVFSGSGYFKVKKAPRTTRPLSELDAERAKAVLIIEPDFGRDLAAGKPVSAQLVLDGADNSSSSVVLSYLAGIQEAARRRLLKAPPPALELRTRFLFNPELNSHWFVIPGLAVILIGLVATLLTALTVAREWENGSMELLLSTPVRPLEIILGKLAPYFGLGLAAVSFVYAVARLVFGVPFAGSHLLFAVATLMFLAATLSQGLFISVATRQQQLAMQFSIVTTMLPSILLSGFVFPVQNMPPFFRGLTSILAPRWYMTIVLAVRRFKRDLEP